MTRRPRSVRLVALTGLVLAGLAASACTASGGRGSEASAPSTSASAASPPRAQYEVELRASIDAMVWRGRETIEIVNPDGPTIHVAVLRLWGNGVDGCSSPPAVQLTGLGGGEAGPPGLGCTMLPVQLDHPVPRGESTRITFGVAIRVPNRRDRFGQVGTTALVGNAIPVLDGRIDGVYLRHPYSDLGESTVADPADVDLTFDVPDGVVVRATGDEVRAPGQSGREVVTATASRVRDLAFVAGPLVTRSATSSSGIDVRLSYDPSSRLAGRAAQGLKAATRAVDDFTDRFGTYPFADLDVVLVDLPFGGMEYSGLVLARPGAIVHEVAHQWWFGVVGNDQYTAPWLDEGFATYAEGRELGFLVDYCPAEWPAPDDRLTSGMDHWDRYPDRYADVIYGQGACALWDLGHLLGTGEMDDLLRDYAAAHRFGRSTVAAFVAAAEEAAAAASPPIDLTSFWVTHRIDA